MARDFQKNNDALILLIRLKFANVESVASAANDDIILNKSIVKSTICSNFKFD